MLVGAVVSAAGTIQQGKVARRTADYNAAVTRQEAERLQQQAALDAREHDRSSRRYMARQRALYGGSGVTLSGTPQLVLMDTAAEAEFQKQKILYGGTIDAQRLETQAQLMRFEGRSAQRAAYGKAAVTLLTGASSLGGPSKPNGVPKKSTSPSSPSGRFYN